jgi:hypothetical protein
MRDDEMQIAVTEIGGSACARFDPCDRTVHEEPGNCQIVQVGKIESGIARAKKGNTPLSKILLPVRFRCVLPSGQYSRSRRKG